MSRLALVFTMLTAVGCGLEVVELAPTFSEGTEIVVVGSVPKSAIDRFERERASSQGRALAWKYPEDRAAIPDDGAPVPFVWDKAKHKPAMMEPKPESPMAGAKPPKPGPGAEPDFIYELRLRSDTHEARIYTRETQVSPPESTWRALLAGQQDRTLAAELRALSLSEKGVVLAGSPLRLAVRAGALAGTLYFRTQGMQPFARASFGASRSENLAWECRDPALAATRGHLAVRCDGRARVHQLPALDELSSFDGPKKVAGFALDESGARLVVAYDNALDILSSRGELLSHIEFDANARVADAVWSPDGSSIAFAYWEPSSMPDSVDAPGASIASIRSDTSGAVAAPAVLAPVGARDLTHRFPRFSPDGQLLAYTRGKGDLGKLEQATLVVVPTSAAATAVELAMGGAMGKRGGPGQIVFVPSVRPASWWLVFAAQRDAPFDGPGERAQLWASSLEVGAGGALALSPPFWLPLQDPMVENTQPEWAPAP